MQVDIPDVKQEMEAAFALYETALVTNDVATLEALFRDDPRTLRYGVAEILYGMDEIRAFRRGRSPLNLMRKLDRTIITTYGRDFATANTLYHPRQRARKARTPIANLGSLRGWLAHRRRACQRDRRAIGELIQAAALSARNARQPPNWLMSRAPAVAAASTRKPLTWLPSASVDRAEAERRRNARDKPAESIRRHRPDFRFDRRHRSSRPAICPAAQCFPATESSDRSRRFRPRARTVPPSATTSRLSGRPRICAPNSATSIRSGVWCRIICTGAFRATAFRPAPKRQIRRGFQRRIPIPPGIRRARMAQATSRHMACGRP